ncbi:MAG: hypothetical protein JWO76_992 [Nocardioides sp.]|nr:hypothetical protein [Nocardioides sp.]
MQQAVVRSLIAAAVLSVAAATLGALPAAEAAPAAQAARETSCSDLTLHLGTYNIRSNVSLDNFRTAVDAFKPMADVVGLQEIGANAKNKYLLRDHGWGYTRPPQLQQNPVIWRRDCFDQLSVGGYKIAKRRPLGNEQGAGADAKGDSWATVVRLVQRSSGQPVTVVNVHLVHGAVKAGRPWPGRPKLFKLYTDQVAGVVAAVREEREKHPGAQLYVQGDFNVGYEADVKRHKRLLPFKRFGAIGLTSMWKGSPYLKKSYGTHSDALIDQVWTTRTAETTSIVRSIRQSDHFPAIATYTSPTPPDGYAPTNGTVGFEDTAKSHDQKWANGHHPVMSFALTGDVAHGYAGVEVVKDNGDTAVEGKDFWVDDSGLYDNDLSSNAVLVELFPDKKKQNPEDDETFTLRLKNPVNTTIIDGRGEAVGTILSNKG